MQRKEESPHAVSGYPEEISPAQSSSTKELEALLESLKSLEEDLGNHPSLFGERNNEARRHARAIISDLTTELEKQMNS